jgi:hypothetical protein
MKCCGARAYVATVVTNAPTRKRSTIGHPYFFSGLGSHNASLGSRESDRAHQTDTAMRVGMINLIGGLPMPRNRSGRATNNTTIVTAGFKELILAVSSHPRPLLRRAATRVRWSEESGWNLGQVIDNGLKRRWRNRLAFRFSSLHPNVFGSENFREGLLRAPAESGAMGKIRNVRNVAVVFFAVENVEVVVSQSSPPRDRLNRSTRASNCFNAC